MPKKVKSKKTKKFKIPLLEIEDYAKVLDADIFELLGLKNIPAKKKEQLGNKIARIIIDRVLIRLDSMLKGPELAEFKYLLENASSQDLQNFFTSKGIDIPKMMIQEAIVLKAQIVQFVAASTAPKSSN